MDISASRFRIIAVHNDIISLTIFVRCTAGLKFTLFLYLFFFFFFYMIFGRGPGNVGYNRETIVDITDKYRTNGPQNSVVKVTY